MHSACDPHRIHVLTASDMDPGSLRDLQVQTRGEFGGLGTEVNGWNTTHDDATQDSGLGVHLFDLPAATLALGQVVWFCESRTSFGWAPPQQ